MYGIMNFGFSSRQEIVQKKKLSAEQEETSIIVKIQLFINKINWPSKNVQLHI